MMTATSQPGHFDWQEADQQLRRLAARRAALDAEEAHWLLIARRERVHEHHGFGSFVEYCERVLGYRPHTTRERLRVAEALVALPETAAALGRGELPYSAIRELTRVATGETERAWLDAAHARTIGEIELLVSGHAPGDLPDDPADPDLEPRDLHLRLSPEVYAMFLETRRAIREETGHDLDDSDLIAALCERALRSRDNGARFDVAITRCPTCERVTQDAGGKVIEIPPAVVERATCDIPKKIRKSVIRRDHGRCVVPGCRHATFVDVHHIVPRAQGGPHTADNLIVLCDAHHRAVHDRRLRISGRAPDFLVIEHADGRVYGTDAASQLGRDVPMEHFLPECPCPTG